MKAYTILWGLVLIMFVAIVAIPTTAIAHPKQFPDSTTVTFGKVYNDVKSGLVELGAALKVGAEHVYIVLVRQQRVNAITSTVLYVFIIFDFWLFAWALRTAEPGSKVTLTDVVSIISGLLALVGAIYFFATLRATVGGYVNPEYGAIKDILRIIQH